VNDNRDFEKLEQLLRQTADDFRQGYPPTPPIAASVRRELEGRGRARSSPYWRARLAWAAAIALVAFAALLLISPGVREAVARFLGLDTVRIEYVATLPSPTIQPTPARPLAGETTLDQAQAQAHFDLRLPTYPTNLGEPVSVYFQDFGPENPQARQAILIYPDFTLYEAQGWVYFKSIDSSTLLEEIEVNGARGLWLSGGEHFVQVQTSAGRANVEPRRVEGNVLAWEAGGVTYRLETQLPLEEAVRIAAALR